MKNLKDLLLLGDFKLYEISKIVLKDELPYVKKWVTDLQNVMDEIRKKYNFGRAIAAPQLGIMKRLIYINIDKPIIILNPEITYKSEEMFDLWDDCMSLPNLYVKVKRHKKINIKYTDEFWKQQELKLENDLSELIQHEYDHLEGILCTMRAIDNKSFKWRHIEIE